jgi:GNAT superfamily N-acetyltransferase
MRLAGDHDVAAICAFGRAHIPAHYTPLIGESAADSQVRDWWSEDAISPAVAAGRIVLLEQDDRLTGVAQWGPSGDRYAVYKLYLRPGARGRGLGRLLLTAVEAALPADADIIRIEHFAANRAAGRFYEREGFDVVGVDPAADGDRRGDVVWRERPRRVRFLTLPQISPARRIIRLFPDHGRDFPLWEDGSRTWDVGYTMAPEDYGLSAGLSQSLRDWQSSWEAHADPFAGWDSPAHRDAWIREGRRLADRLRVEVSAFADVRAEFE